MSADYFYRNIGNCFYLLAHSDTHRNFNLSRYMDVEICPANWLGQLRIYTNVEQQPVGFVTWARVSPEVKEELIVSSRALMFDEWNKGSELFFNDFVAPWGGVRNMLNDMTKNVFPKEEAFSVSRDSNGDVEKVQRWVGKQFHLNRGDGNKKKTSRWVDKR